MKRTPRVLAVAALAVAGLALAPAAPASAHPDHFPSTIDLPVGFRPEGITTGPGPFAYLGSLADGRILRVNLVTGAGKVISPALDPPAPSVGLKSDQRGRLFVAGGSGGNGRVIDARTGAVLRSYQFASDATTFVNDVVLTPDAAWFTDSMKMVLYKVPLGRHGTPARTFQTLTLTGIPPVAGFNLNGIARTPDGRALLVVQSARRPALAGRPEDRRLDPGRPRRRDACSTATACCCWAGSCTWCRTGRTRSP